MNKTVMAIAFCLAFYATSATAQTKADQQKPEYDAALAAKLGADEYGMKQYVYVLLKTGSAEIKDEAKRKAIFAGHFENMGKLAEAGKLVAAGPFDDPNGIKRGFYIFNVSTIEAAEELVKSDPAVKAGIFEAELTKLYSSAALMMVNEIHNKIQKTAIN